MRSRERVFLSRLPVMENYPRYDDSCRDLAFVIPLFTLNDKKTEFLEELLLSSLWVANSMIVNADVVERRIPIFWFVEDVLADRCAGVLIDAGVRRDRIVYFSSLETDLIRENRISKNLWMIDNKELLGYDCLICWDADLFVCRLPGFGKLAVEMFEGPSFGVMRYEVGGGDYDYRRKADWWLKYGDDDLETSFDRTVKQIKDNFFLCINRETTFFHVSAGIIRFPLPVPERFKQFCLRSEPILGDDELIFYLWAQQEGIEIDEVDYPESVWSVEQFFHLRDVGLYLSHVYDGGCEDMNWELIWQRDAGILR